MFSVDSLVGVELEAGTEEDAELYIETLDLIIGSSSLLGIVEVRGELGDDDNVTRLGSWEGRAAGGVSRLLEGTSNGGSEPCVSGMLFSDLVVSILTQ